MIKELTGGHTLKNAKYAIYQKGDNIVFYEVYKGEYDDFTTVSCTHGAWSAKVDPTGHSVEHKGQHFLKYGTKIVTHTVEEVDLGQFDGLYNY